MDFRCSGSYTFSKCLDGPGSEEGGSPAAYLDRLYKGPCSFDVPHNFVTSYVWELPFGNGRKYFSQAPRAVNSSSAVGSGKASIHFNRACPTR